jgi:hypothetical protein
MDLSLAELELPAKLSVWRPTARETAAGARTGRGQIGLKIIVKPATALAPVELISARGCASK